MHKNENMLIIIIIHKYIKYAYHWAQYAYPILWKEIYIGLRM